MGLLGLFAQPFKKLHLPPAESFAGQTVIITGGNTGLGLETARHIVALGAAKVILGVRTLSKGEAAKSDIESSTGRTGVVEVWELDLERYDSVKGFAARAERLNRLDTAIMNAGVASLQWNMSPEGYERQIQVNVLSTALLMLLLLPVLIRAAKEEGGRQPHLILVGSDMHAEASFKQRNSENILDALNDKIKWEKGQSIPTERYAVSKLLSHYMGYEIARITPQIKGKPAVIVNIIAPGFCKSDLMNHEPGHLYLLEALQFLTARTTEEGSKAVVDGAMQGPESHGQFLDHQKAGKVGRLVSSDEGQRLMSKVWREVLEILGPVAPEIERVAYGDL